MIKKYPRTRHLEGSRLQPGDHDLTQEPLASLHGKYIVVEEKLDGANAGISIDEDGKLQLQSRGHYLVGGHREKHWDLFKQWARTHEARLRELLEGGLVLYGEWLYAKHTIFYDELPHYFLEFDIRDPSDKFWSTARRREHLENSIVSSVPVIWEGFVDDPNAIPKLVARSLYKSERWRDKLPDDQRVRDETDASDEAEGLYIKVEDPETRVVEDRFKWVRASFLTAVVDSGSHWLARPITPNQLAEGVDLFG